MAVLSWQCYHGNAVTSLITESTSESTSESTYQKLAFNFLVKVKNCYVYVVEKI